MLLWGWTALVNKEQKSIIVLVIFSIIIIFFSGLVGRYYLSLDDFFNMLNGTGDVEHVLVILHIRIPRIIAAFLIGAALSVSGAVYQGVFSNPLVSPDVLGVSSMSALGSAIALLFGLALFWVNTVAFAFGLCAVFFVFSISKKIKISSLLSLVLTGILIGSLATSTISFIKLIADPYDTLPSITYYLMGSLNNMNFKTVGFITPIIILSLIGLYSIRWRLNILSFTDIEAKNMGINPARIRLVALTLSSVLTSISIATSGLIGWVGLVVPHLARLIVGSDFRYLLTASALLGGIFLTIVDTLSRTITTIEIPLGILTSITAIPFFMYLIMRRNYVIKD